MEKYSKFEEIDQEIVYKTIDDVDDVDDEMHGDQLLGHPAMKEIEALNRKNLELETERVETKKSISKAILRILDKIKR